jgi:hypothetical protein
MLNAELGAACNKKWLKSILTGPVAYKEPFFSFKRHCVEALSWQQKKGEIKGSDDF